MGSDTQRAGIHTANNTSSVILNTWNPEYNRAPSDFDTRHLITGSFVYQLPFGTGQKLAGSSNRLVNAIIGGWQSSGLIRWTSGLPFSLLLSGVGHQLGRAEFCRSDGPNQVAQAHRPRRPAAGLR